MGWADEAETISSELLQADFEKIWNSGGPKAFAHFMRGVVGPCIIEALTEGGAWLFASSASAGFYYRANSPADIGGCGYLVSNEEGRLFRTVLRMGGELSEGAVMNAVLSHQAVIRPIFSGFFDGVYRCPPGFYLEISPKECNLKSFIISKHVKTRSQQDTDLRKKMIAVSKIYEEYSKRTGAAVTLAFSGGVDSTALLLLHKTGLNQERAGYYKNRGKVSEKAIACEIAGTAGVPIDVIEPYESFSPHEAKRRASAGLATLNGVAYLKHGFRYSPIDGNDQSSLLIVTGQNSDTMFHIDHYAPSSFLTGVARIGKLIAGMGPRFRTTVMYFWLSQIFSRDSSEYGLPPSVLQSYMGVSEHGDRANSFPRGTEDLLASYKRSHYVDPLVNWLRREVYPQLNASGVGPGLRVNHAARLARWLRTIGGFHQQFLNIGSHEKVTICTPFSEGPVANELLTYRLSFKDVVTPKRFLHDLIRAELGISYAMVRRKILGGGISLIYEQVVKRVKRVSKKAIRAIRPGSIRGNQSEATSESTKIQVISLEDLRKLREILVDRDGVVRRSLLNYVREPDSRSYLNHLYDCLEFKVDPGLLGKRHGMELCRLINLQVMIDFKASSDL